MRILILCTGNSCRSQMAHGILQSFDKNIVVRSAGTEPALTINRTAVQVMQEIGIDISNHKPMSVENYIYDEWDFVITVCDDAKETCPIFTGKVNKQLHMGFEDPSRVKGSDEYILSEFRRVRNEIKETFYNLYFEQIKPQL